MSLRMTTPTPSFSVGRANAGGTVQYSLPGVAISAGGTLALSANQVRYFPILVDTTITIDQFGLEVTAAGAAATTLRMGLYSADTDWQPTSLILDAGTVAADSLGVKTLSPTAFSLAPGRYVLAINTDGAPTVRTVRGGFRSGLVVIGLGTNIVLNFLRGVQAYAAFPSTGTAYSTAGGGTNAFDYPIFLRLSVP